VGLRSEWNPLDYGTKVGLGGEGGGRYETKRRNWRMRGEYANGEAGWKPVHRLRPAPQVERPDGQVRLAGLRGAKRWGRWQDFCSYVRGWAGRFLAAFKPQAHEWGWETYGPKTWLTVWPGDMGYRALNPRNHGPAEHMEMTERWKAWKSKCGFPTSSHFHWESRCDFHIPTRNTADP
jgi:hypothetical protein